MLFHGTWRSSCATFLYEVHVFLEREACALATSEVARGDVTSEVAGALPGVTSEVAWVTSNLY